MDTQIGKMCGVLHHKMFELNKVRQFTDFKTRLVFLNAHILGKINYLIPLYMSANKDQLNKIHKVLMTAARSVIGNYCFKKSTVYILNKCGWLGVNNMIKCASVKLIHKIITDKSPITIFELYKINARSNVDIVTHYKPKLKKTEQFFVYKGIQIYNKVPKNIKANKTINMRLKNILKL